jgi:hypothetical protein
MGRAVPHDFEGFGVPGRDQANGGVFLDGSRQVNDFIFDFHGNAIAGQPFRDAFCNGQPRWGGLKGLSTSIGKCDMYHFLSFTFHKKVVREVDGFEKSLRKQLVKVGNNPNRVKKKNDR